MTITLLTMALGLVGAAALELEPEPTPVPAPAPTPAPASASTPRPTTPTSSKDDRATVIVVVGTPGTPDYDTRFRSWAGRWRKGAEAGSAEFIAVGLEPEAGKTDHDRLRATLAEKTKGSEQAQNQGPLWLVLIGHGTFDGREAKFNLKGPDLTELELSEWLEPIKRPVAILNCTSASGPFLTRLSGPNRIVVSATRSGNEQNYARIGQYLAQTITDPAADLDKDNQVSLLEAYLTASSRVEQSYKEQAQLATEHPLLDDNGDKLGTPPDWFRGTRATRRAKDGAPLDGLRANQLVLVPSDRERTLSPDLRRKRDQLELDIASLRDQKAALEPDDYYAKLEPLMLQLAELYQSLPNPPK